MIITSENTTDLLPLKWRKGKYSARPISIYIQHQTHTVSSTCGADIRAWACHGGMMGFMAPGGVLREPEGSMSNGNIWQQVCVTDSSRNHCPVCFLCVRHMKAVSGADGQQCWCGVVEVRPDGSRMRRMEEKVKCGGSGGSETKERGGREGE